MDRMGGMLVFVAPVADAAGDEGQSSGGHHEPPEPARGPKVVKRRGIHAQPPPVEIGVNVMPPWDGLHDGFKT